MTNWRPEFDRDHLYFITTKAVDHMYLFQRDTVMRLLVDTLDCLQLRKWLTLYAFVIMPNHIHLIVQCPAERPVKEFARVYKRHVAERLLCQYQAENNQQGLNLLAAKVPRPGKQAYKVWEDGYSAKNVFSPGFLRQKMEYIHNNPCQPQWDLVADPADYIWSSARFYLTNQPSIIPVKDARRLMVG
jgi:putative transposase